jgi:hypothetical protein
VNNPIRLQLLEQLARLSELAPEMRMGQLIANLAVIAEGPWDETLWDLDDEKLLAAAEQLAADLAERNERVAS